MSLSNVAENLIYNALFRNSGLPGIGDASGLGASAAAGSLYVSLHSDDPGEAGDQTTNEADYTDYTRIAVGRATGFTVTTAGVYNADVVTFPASVGNSGNVAYWGLGFDETGAGTLLMSDAFDSTLVVVSGVTPQIAASGLQIIGN